VEEYLNKQKEIMKNSPIYNSSFTLHHISKQKMEQMKNEIGDGIGYVE
jgi:hypothetical protein